MEDSERPGRAPFVLVVEDEAAILRLAKAVLERDGFRVLTAADVDEALAVAERQAEEVNLLVVDARLPGGRGEALAERLRERWPDLAVVLTSGHPESVRDLSGTAAFLPKPFGPDDLLRVARERLNGDTSPRG